MRNQQSKAMVTMMVKARVANKYRKLFFNDKKLSPKQFFESFSQVQRLQIFTDLFGDIRDMHQELNNIKRERKYRAEVEKLRVERGYVKKKKTPKEQKAS